MVSRTLAAVLVAKVFGAGRSMPLTRSRFGYSGNRSGLDEGFSKERMHLGLETDDVGAEVKRLEALGASR
jgi:hypothetical protein